jgi:hypothetical protein
LHALHKFVGRVGSIGLFTALAMPLIGILGMPSLTLWYVIPLGIGWWIAEKGEA